MNSSPNNPLSFPLISTMYLLLNFTSAFLIEHLIFVHVIILNLIAYSLSISNHNCFKEETSRRLIWLLLSSSFFDYNHAVKFATYVSFPVPRIEIWTGNICENWKADFRLSHWIAYLLMNPKSIHLDFHITVSLSFFKS